MKILPAHDALVFYSIDRTMVVIVIVNTTICIASLVVRNSAVCLSRILYKIYGMGYGGALVESIAFNRRVVGSTPALAAM